MVIGCMTDDLNTRLLVWYSGRGLNNGLAFSDQIDPQDLNIRLVWFSDPHCIVGA